MILAAMSSILLFCLKPRSSLRRLVSFCISLRASSRVISSWFSSFRRRLSFLILIRLKYIAVVPRTPLLKPKNVFCATLARKKNGRSYQPEERALRCILIDINGKETTTAMASSFRRLKLNRFKRHLTHFYNASKKT